MENKKETPEQYCDRVYPLADENDYPENPKVNYQATVCRAAFMNGVRFATQQQSPLSKAGEGKIER